MKFRQALRDIVINKGFDLTQNESDKGILIAYAAYCESNSDLLQLQELKNILSTGVNLAQNLLHAYWESTRNADTSFKPIADAIEQMADELEKNHISCFSYSYYISCYLDLFKERFHDDEAYNKLDIESVAWINPEQYDYSYQATPTSEKTFGFGRYHAAIKDFVITNGVLEKYKGKESYVIIPNFVKSIGNSAFLGNKHIKSIYIPYAVSKIGETAFSGCEKLETVVLGENVTKLGNSTFEECKRLKRINLDKIHSVGDRCFKGCVMLEKVNVPVLSLVGDEAFAYCVSLQDTGFISNLTKIGCRAFEHCKMNYISLEKCKRLGDQAFLDCTSITRISMTSDLATIGSTPFMGCRAVCLLNISDSSYSGYVHDLFVERFEDFNDQITQLKCIKRDYVKNSEFAGYEALQEVEIRSSTIIPDGAFAGCKNLTAVKFDVAITAIGQSAFASCVSLTDLGIRFVGDEIAERAFYKCGKLSAEPILSHVTKIGDFAFAYTDLSTFNFNRTFKRIGAFAFANAKFPAKVSLDLRGCEVLPGAFHGASEIVTLKIDSLDDLYQNKLHLLFDKAIESFVSNRKINYILVSGSITDKAFAGYGNIRYVEFVADGERIPNRAFMNCTSLESVKVFGKISIIEAYAFSGCECLSLLDMQYDSVKVEDHAFYDCRNAQTVIDFSRVTWMGEYAFAQTDISDLVLSKEVRYIGKSAFSACPGIQKVVLPFVGCEPNAEAEAGYFGSIFGADPMDMANVQKIETGSAEYVFYIPYNIRTVTILSDTLSPDCFEHCTFLTEIDLPNIVDFTTGAFADCSNMQFVSLGKHLSAFSAEALAGCEKTVKVNVDPDCIYFKSIDGSVVSKDEKVLYFLNANDNLDNRVAMAETVAYYAVPLAPDTLVLSSPVTNVERYAFNCTNTRSIKISAIQNIQREAFCNCDFIEAIEINDAGTDQLFSCSESTRSIEKLSLENCTVHSVKDIFSGVQDLTIGSLFISGVSLHDSIVFAGVSAIRELKISTEIEISHRCLANTTVDALSMCGQAWTASDLLGDDREIKSILISDGNIHENEFQGMSVDLVTLENVDTISQRAFNGCTIQKLIIRNVARIEPCAFSGSKIGDISVEADAYTISDGILYHDNELVYCTDHALKSFTIPQFVTHVFAGAFEDIQNLRQITVSHPGIKFDAVSFIGCPQLHTLELEEVSNKCLKEIFDDAVSIAFIKYNGETIKRKFFSHLHKVCEIQLTNVREVYDLAFCGDTALETISGLDSATYIGDMAFAGCSSLTSIALSQSCARIGLGAFDGCTGLKKAVYPIDAHQVTYEISAAELFGDRISDELTIEINGGDIPPSYFADFRAGISVVNSPRIVGDNAFKNSGLTQILLSDTTEIGDFAFYRSKIQSVKMPKAKRIGASAFANCVALKEIVLNNSIESLGSDWIAQSPISAITGAENGAKYRTANNYLVDCADNALIYVAPFGGDIVIDDGVSRITSSAFDGSHAKSIDACAVKVIDAEAFSGCSNLESIKLPYLRSDSVSVPLKFLMGSNMNLKRVELSDGDLAEECFVGFGNLETIILPNHIKEIPDRCFAGCTSLAKAENLACAEKIGENAFEGCCSLKVITLPFLGSSKIEKAPLSHLFGSNQSIKLTDLEILEGECAEGAFEGCSTLVNITLPKGIKSIPKRCFSGCSMLQTVSNVDEVESIEAKAFAGCISLVEMDFPKVETVGDNAFDSCVSLAGLKLSPSLKQIGKTILEGCSNLADLTIMFNEKANNVASLGRGVPNKLSSVTVMGATLGKFAFANCAHLKDVTLSDLIQTIPEQAFAGCISLESFSSGKTVQEIGYAAFMNCSKLASLDCFEKTARIGEKAFSNSGLNCEVKLPEIQAIGPSAFSASPIQTVSLGSGISRLELSTFESCVNLSAVSFSDKLVFIAARSFSGCKSLENIDLSNAKELGEKAFYGCTSLKTIELKSIKSLGCSCFEDCSSLSGAFFNDSLEVIPERAFAGCKSLNMINVPGQLTVIGNRAFAGTAMKKVELKMPPSLKEVGEYIFEDAYSPIVLINPGQTVGWDSRWDASCKGHGLFNLSKKVITKKY